MLKRLLLEITNDAVADTVLRITLVQIMGSSYLNLNDQTYLNESYNFNIREQILTMHFFCNVS